MSPRDLGALLRDVRSCAINAGAIGVETFRFAFARHDERGAFVRVAAQQLRVGVGSVGHRLQIDDVEQHVVATNAVAVRYAHGSR